jgi:hypothetical protein
MKLNPKFQRMQYTLRGALYVLFGFMEHALYAQSDHPPQGHPAYHAGDRLEVLSGQPAPWHTTFRMWSRADLCHYAEQLDTARVKALTPLDLQDLDYIYRDNSEWLTDSSRIGEPNRFGWRRWIYPTKANLFEVNNRHFMLRINPILAGSVGRESLDSLTLFGNYRGVEVRGAIDDRVWFYTSLIEQQNLLPVHVRDYTRRFAAVPGAGFYKNYTSTIFNSTNAFDYNVAQAYIGLRATRHIGVQFGHGNHFIGNGFRSILLSDFGSNNFFLKINTRVWKFHYQNLFMELTPFSSGYLSNGIDDLLPKKYAAVHILDFKLAPRTSVGIFEATVFQREKQFELQYLNPIIFYRTVEGFIGSPDNVLLGLNANTVAFNRVRLYGQFLMDEFLFSQVFRPEQSGWWGNKFGFQGGIKYFNVLNINHLDLQVEYNQVRPYTFTHRDSTTGWSHYSQPLAHPLGANFREWMGQVRYQPHHRLALTGRAVWMRTGDDDTQNWGSNLLLTNVTRPNEFGNTIGQGIATRTFLWRAGVSYQIWHNMFIDINIMQRHKNSENNALDSQNTIIGGGLRLNFWEQNFDF